MRFTIQSKVGNPAIKEDISTSRKTGMARVISRVPEDKLSGSCCQGALVGWESAEQDAPPPKPQGLGTRHHA